MTEREFVALAASKRSKRSSFNDRIFLEYTEHRIVPRDQLLRRRFAAATDRQEPRSAIWPGTYRARARLSGSAQAGPMSVIGRPWTPPHGGELHLGHL